jgi:hypothetical protein
MLLQAIPAGATVLEAGCGRTTRLADHLTSDTGDRAGRGD